MPLYAVVSRTAFAAGGDGGRRSPNNQDDEVRTITILDWLPDTRREWIGVIIAAVFLGLLMVITITELEVISADQWWSNLALAEECITMARHA